MKLEDILEGKVFLIDKPLEWTSFDVVNKIRWNIRKTYNLKNKSGTCRNFGSKSYRVISDMHG